ncbi:MAG: hypothetical protein SPL54_03145 [Lachnospiraceae bacterium]|nr:hypothetical protein [Lachnospiraceae bacterium]
MTKRFRKKSTRILLAAEFLFVLLIITAAVRGRQEGESKVYSLDYASLYADKGVSMETFPYSAFSGIYLDNSLMDDGQKELAVKTPLLPLSPGAYRVDVVYSTGDSGNYLSVQSGERYLSTADKAYIILPAGADRTESVTIRTFFSMEDLSISVHYPGNGYLFVSGVTVTRIPGFPWPFLVCGIELFAVLHILLFLWQRYGECGGGKRKILAFLLGLSVAVSLPIFSVYLGTGDDLEYHLLRIDALAAGLRDGQFPVRVSSYWNNGYGYGSSLYYCDFFLLFPALLRIGGLSAQSAYKQYLFAINFLTAALCWYSFRKIGSRRSAALGTILYTFLPYRILCLYRRAAVGEYTAMAFLPLAAAGIYQIYTSRPLPQGSRLKREIRVILPAALGFCGLILSHIITTFFAVIAVIIVLLIRIRKTLKPAVLKRLAGTIVLTFALCAWFAIPFADSMRNDIGTMQETQEKASIEGYGTYISQLMDLFPSAAGGNVSTEDEPAARQNGTPDIVYSAGVALYGTVLWIAYGLTRRKKRAENEAIEENGQEDSRDNGNRRENKEAARCRFRAENETVRDSSGSDAAGRTLGNIAAWAGLICAFMSTVWFPWNSIAAAAPALNQIVRNIQFPWRILSLAGIFMVIATVELSEKMRGPVPAENAEKVLAASLVGAALISGLFLLHDYTVSTNVRNYTGTPAVDTTGIAGAEYLPVGTDTAIFTAQDPVPGEGVTIETAERDGGTWQITVSSADGSAAGGDDISEGGSCMEVPFLYYPGYIGKDAKTHQRFIAVPGSGGRARIELPEGYQGTIEIRYSERKLWRGAELLSVITVILLFFILKGRTRRIKSIT